MISIQTALLRLGLALVLGAVIGLERERGDRAAGLRTHALVALGACLAMIVSAYGFEDVMRINNISLDPSRIAAQVISGIGFLGAGTILLRKEIVKGLTTAAAIWVVAAIGLACGCGLLLEAIAATVLTIGILVLLQPLRQRVRKGPEVQHLRIKVLAETVLLSQVYTICTTTSVTMENIELQTGRGRDKMEIECATSEAGTLVKSLTALRDAEGMESIVVNVRNPSGTVELFQEEPILT